MNCIFCKNPIPKERWEFREGIKYCSSKCIKRTWYVKSLKEGSNSSFIKGSRFEETETGRGFKWEVYAANFLKAKHIEFNKYGADLDWNGKSVDVKCSNLSKRKMKRGKPTGDIVGTWSFKRGKGQDNVDFFFCVCLLKGKLFRKYLIPGREYPKGGVCMGWKSKYDKYLI